jgi:hypothetical protein
MKGIRKLQNFLVNVVVLWNQRAALFKSSKHVVFQKIPTADANGMSLIKDGVAHRRKPEAVNSTSV